MNNLAPIALFTYNRPEHTRQTVEALAGNILASVSRLTVFSDGPKTAADAENVIKTRQYLKTIKGFMSVEIIERDANLGLAGSIIDGVTQIVNRSGKIIVVEDDIVTSPYFLEYMNRSLEMYRSDNRAVCIHGYVPPVGRKLPDTFFLRGADCWGWATWKRGWELFNPNAGELLAQIEAGGLARRFNFDNTYRYTRMLRRQSEGVIDSWAIRWHASAFIADRLTLYPGRSLVFNAGFDGSGVHCRPRHAEPPASLSDSHIEFEKISLTENEQAYRAFVKHYRYRNAVNKLKQVLWINR
jgi:hypothetical protein